MAATSMKMSSACSRGASVRVPRAPKALRALPAVGGRRKLAQPVMAASALPADVPSPEKRTTMNLLLVGAASLPIGIMGVPYLGFFIPQGAGGAGGAQSAKDALGNDITLESWTKTHLPGDHSLSQGLKGDPTYLIVKEDGSIEKYGLNAVCTHLGCVVPWVAAENKFKCPCHGSQYDFTGKVVRGPAPLSLALAHCDIGESGAVLFSTWTEQDFRTETNPWWS